MSRKLLLNNVKAELDKFFWIGVLPYDESGEIGWCDFEQDILNANESFLEKNINAENIIKLKEDEMFIAESIEMFMNEADYLIAIAPEGYTVMIDNGNGTPTPFNENNGGYSINAEPAKELIGGVQYYVYGFMSYISGERTIYVFAD